MLAFIGSLEMNGICKDLMLVVIFGVISGVLLVIGLISLAKGFDIGWSALIIVSGLGLLFATFMLAQEFGFMEKWWLP
jgi:hypothetical protein